MRAWRTAVGVRSRSSQAATPGARCSASVAERRRRGSWRRRVARRSTAVLRSSGELYAGLGTAGSSLRRGGGLSCAWRGRGAGLSEASVGVGRRAGLLEASVGVGRRAGLAEASAGAGRWPGLLQEIVRVTIRPSAVRWRSRRR
ncbi:hypothetical protein AQJ58_27965 [Streptomyces sp. DSM 15324]|nr:hypothetical protein AQJ58_27965 [Streptomyces sp. DSM 15324]